MLLVSSPARRSSSARSQFSLLALPSRLVRRPRVLPTVKLPVKALVAELRAVAAVVDVDVLVALVVAAELYV